MSGRVDPPLTPGSPSQGRAPDAFAEWLRDYVFNDRNGKLPPGLVLQYHSRSDIHSKKLGELIVEDLIATCDVMAAHARAGRIAYGINARHRWLNGKQKTIDLAIGIPDAELGPCSEGIHRLPSKAGFARLLIACEEKAVMTEHGKSQPRVYSELNDSHTMVHQGDRATIAAAITMVNVARSFISPLRQRPDKEVEVTLHNQPWVAQSMVAHLRKLPRRGIADAVGLDAYCSFVIDADNQGHVAAHHAPPAPQPGEADHYESFLSDICATYSERFGDLDHLPPQHGLSLEEAFGRVAHDNPGLLRRIAEDLLAAEGAGTKELAALLDAMDVLPPAPEDL